MKDSACLMAHSRRGRGDHGSIARSTRSSRRRQAPAKVPVGLICQRRCTSGGTVNNSRMPIPVGFAARARRA